SVPCKRAWQSRPRPWMGGWRPTSRPQATLPSYLDDDGRHVVCSGAPRPLADPVHEGGNDFAWWFVAVCPDHLEGPPNAEQRAIARGRLDDPIGKQEEEITGFQADRGAAGKNAGGVHAQRKARTSEDQPHLAAPVEDVARQVSGAAVDQGAREGMEPAEEEGDKVIRIDILDGALMAAVENWPGVGVGGGERARVGGVSRAQRGRPTPVAARIAGGDPPVAARQGDEVEVAPAGLLGG